MMRNHGPLDFTEAERVKWLKDRATHVKCKEFARNRIAEISKIQHRLKKKAYYLHMAGYPEPPTRDGYYTEAVRIYNRRTHV